MNRRNILVLLPAVLFAGLALLFYKGLSGDPSTLPSALINKPVPTFNLPAVDQLGVPGLADSEFENRPDPCGEHLGLVVCALP